MTLLNRSLLVVCFYILSVNGYSQKLKRDFSAFPVNEQLRITDFLKAGQFEFDKIDLYRDSVLVFIKGSPSDQEHHINFYDINKKQFLPGMLGKGRSDGQSTGFIFYGLEKDYLWVYDMNKEQIISMRMDSLHDNKVKRFIKTRYIPRFYYSVQSVNDTTFLANGNYDGTNDYKIAKFNLNTGKPGGYMVPYSADPSKPFKPDEKMAYESFLFIRPLKDKAVNAARYADQIEIIDLNTQQVKTVRGPEGFEPELELMIHPQDGRRLGIRTERTRFAFHTGKVTNQFIYLLYSGYTDRTEHRDYGSKIYVYDWNGKPVKMLSLKNDIKSFAVTANDDKIYTYNPITKFIGVADLKPTR